MTLSMGCVWWYEEWKLCAVGRLALVVSRGILGYGLSEWD